MSQDYISNMLLASFLVGMTCSVGLFVSKIRKIALLGLLVAIGCFVLFSWLNEPFAEAHREAQRLEDLKAQALRTAADAKADALSRAAGFIDAEDRKLALATGFPDAKTWGTVRGDVASVIKAYPNNSLTNGDCKYDDPDNRVQTLMFPATKQYPFGTRDVFRCLSKEEAIASFSRQISAGLAKENAKRSTNITVSKGAIACTSLTNAQIAAQLVRNNQQDKIRLLDSCFRIPEGKEVMRVGTAGEYALVATMDDLNHRYWTNVGWLQ